MGGHGEGGMVGSAGLGVGLRWFGLLEKYHVVNLGAIGYDPTVRWLLRDARTRFRESEGDG